ncbi:MAG: hypothetical protein Q9162_000666 [Coniocarpon cinnabarinum]
MNTYVQYMQGNGDESPLYLFDSRFAEKMGLEIDDGMRGRVDSAADSQVDYTPPIAFSPDLFTVLGKERPSHRWLIMGPPRSGSSFHTDPNGTSAWNAVLKGRKYWIMSPDPPPGVYVNEDESEVTSPSSIAEWLMNFHEEARQKPGVCEGICEEGEVLHVPGGWYHLVLNIPSQDTDNSEYNIAVTQNFVPEPRLPTVLKFLRDKPDQISGFRFSDDNQMERAADTENIGRFSAYELFVKRLQECYPTLVTKALSILDTTPTAQPSARKGLWEQVTEGKKDHGGNFSFGFELNDDSNDDERGDRWINDS